MRCPVINELPPSPDGMAGWPWTEETPQLSGNMSGGSLWPKISVVTPSLNQGQFIEETIRSVLLQGYPNLEYIIIDGGSIDSSVEIIEKYERWITHWVSEPDKGQSNAINKGFVKATGEVFAYINSDDLYEPNAFVTVASIFEKNGYPHLIAGECTIFDGDTIKSRFKPWWPKNIDHFLHPFSSTFAQPASFWSKHIYHRVGGFNESLHFCFDQEFFFKIALTGIKPRLISDQISRYREHSDTKTHQTIRFFEETIPVINKYAEECGVSKKEKKEILNKCFDEINYIKVFICWKNRGRIPSIIKFISMIIKSPKLLFQRKILGQARRLIHFKAEDVVELRNV